MDLGSLDLVSTTSGLQLRLSSHVKVASSREDVKDLQNGLSIAAPTFYTERKHLVVAGNDIRLLVSLELDPSVHLDPESLLQAFGQKLYNAVLWNQLQLKPTAVSYTCNGWNAGGSLTVHLKRDEQQAEVQGRQLHRVAQDVPYYDIEPPESVYAIELDRVHLTMSISRRTLTSPTLAPEHDENDSFDFVAFVDTNDNEADLNHHSGDLKLRLNESSHFPTSSPEGDHETDDLDNKATVAQQQKHLMSLLDAGVRHAITSKPKQVASDVKVTETVSLKRLADVAPAIFSPSFLPALASRTVLLPTVAHALGNVAGKHAGSSILRGKMRELARRQPTPAGDPLTQLEAPRVVSLTLWQMMHRSLSDRNAANKLNPLSMAVSSDDALQLEHLELLDSEPQAIPAEYHETTCIDAALEEEFFQLNDPCSCDGCLPDFTKDPPSALAEYPEQVEVKFVEQDAGLWDEMEQDMAVMEDVLDKPPLDLIGMVEHDSGTLSPYVEDILLV